MDFKEQRLFNLLVFAIPFLCLAIVRFIGFDGLYGMDSYEYFRYSKELKSAIINGSEIGSFFWPQGYPILVLLFSLIIPTSLAGQIVCSLSLSLTGLFVEKSAKILFPTAVNSKWLILLAIVCSPYFLRNGIQFMSDIPAVLSFVCCLYFALRYAKKPSFSSLTLCAFFAGFGVFIRLGVGVVLIPVLIFTMFNWFKSKKWIQIFAVIPLVAIYLLYHLLQPDTSEVFQHHFVDEWNVLNFFKTNFPSDEKHGLANLSYTFPNLAYFTFKFLHPGFFALNVVLVGLSLFYKSTKEKLPIYLLVSVVLLNTIFLSGVTVQVERYLFLSYPAFVLLMVPAFDSLLSKALKFKNVALCGLLLVQLGLAVRAIQPSITRSLLEEEIANELSELQGNTLYIFEMDLAMQQRDLTFEYKNLWVEEYNQFEPTALVLFNPVKFKERFEHKTPMKNWNKLNEQYELKEIKSFEFGWNLYKIER